MKCRAESCDEEFSDSVERSLHEYKNHSNVDKSGEVVDSTGYGDNWTEMRERVIERDGVCQNCSEDGSHVHHLEKKDSFRAPEDSNTMDNLVLLCHACHNMIEPLPIEKQHQKINQST